jgi:hypothetical protein
MQCFDMPYKPLTLLCRTRRQQRRVRDEVAFVLSHSYGGNMEEAQLALARRDLTVFRATAKRLGIAVFQKMDAAKTLALLTEANLGVNQARVVKQFLLQHTGNAILESEAVLKEEMKSQALAHTDLEFGEMELEGKGGKSEVVAIGRVRSIDRVVERNMNGTPYHDHGLSPSTGFVPVVLMDDSGGGSEKVAVSIRSVPNPCSTKTVSLVAMTEGNDKLKNKRALSGDLFKQHAKLESKLAYCVSRGDPSSDDTSAASVTTRHRLLTRPGAGYALFLKESSVMLKLLEKRQLELDSDRELPGLLVLLARESDGESPGFATLQFEQYFPSAPSVWEGDDAELFEEEEDVILAQQRVHRRVLRPELHVAKPLEEVWPVVWEHIFSYVGDGFLGACASFKLLKVAGATRADPPVQEPATLDRREKLLKLATDASMGLDRALIVRDREAKEARALVLACNVAFTGAKEASEKANKACSSSEAAAKRSATNLAREATAALKAAQAKLDAAKSAQFAAKELLEGTRGAIVRAKLVVSLLMMHHDDGSALKLSPAG